jgi:5,10-methylenetetrahydromethanopterin reductase
MAAPGVPHRPVLPHLPQQGQPALATRGRHRPGHRPGDISPDLAARICDAFGLFGPPEYCAERLLRAQEEIGRGDELHVFFFPAHTFATGYDLPETDVAAFAETIGPMLG